MQRDGSELGAEVIEEMFKSIEVLRETTRESGVGTNIWASAEEKAGLRGETEESRAIQQ